MVVDLISRNKTVARVVSKMKGRGVSLFVVVDASYRENLNPTERWREANPKRDVVDRKLRGPVTLCWPSASYSIVSYRIVLIVEYLYNTIHN
jgi:hypothetical protein